MLIVSLILVLLCALAAAVGSIWMIAKAFQTSTWWGIRMLIFPFTPIWFALSHWEEAKHPLMCWFAALLLYGAFTTTAPKGSESLAKMMAQHSGQKVADGDDEKKPSSIPGMFQAQKKMEAQIKLISLQKKSNELLERKASLDPADHAGAVALSEEIKKYNEELKTYTQQAKQPAVNTAAR